MSDNSVSAPIESACDCCGAPELYLAWGSRFCDHCMNDGILCRACASPNVYPAWERTVCRDCGYEDRHIDTEDPITESPHLIFIASAESKRKGTPIEENPYSNEDDRHLWGCGWDSEHQTHVIEKRENTRRLSQFDPIATHDLKFLERSLEAGNPMALSEAIQLCHSRGIPPSEWMVRAVLRCADHSKGTLNEERKKRKKYETSVKEMRRFLAIATIRWEYSAEQCRALMSPDTTISEVDEFKYIMKENGFFHEDLRVDVLET